MVALLITGAMGCWMGCGSAPEEAQPPPSTGQPVVSVDSNVQANATKSAAPSSTSATGSFLPQEGLASIPAERFFTTTRMDGLQPADPQTQFSPGDQIYVYAGIHAPSDERIQLRWFGPDGQHILPSIYKHISANTGPVGYRIYTYRIFREPGNYTVRLYNSAGTVIGETGFEVE